MTIEQLIALLTALAVFGGLPLSIASFVSMRRMRKAEALEKETQAHERNAQTRLIEFEVTTKVLATANEELKRHHLEIERLTQRVNELTELIDGVETELEIERKARKEAEQRVERYVIGIRKLIDQLMRDGKVPEWQPETGPLAPIKKP